MRPKRSVAEWRNAVFRSTAITDSVRVVLLLLAEYMREDLTVSVPRKTLATRLGKSERRVSQRIADAHEAGLLDTVVHGRKYTTAVYVGMFPNPLSVTVSSTLKLPTKRHPENGHKPPQRDPRGSHHINSGTPGAGHEGDDGIEESRADLVDAFDGTQSGWSA